MQRQRTWSAIRGNGSPRATIRLGRNAGGPEVCDTVPARRGSPALRAFTLLEIMIVVAIMGIMMGTGIPLVVKAWKKAPMAKALSDFQEVCGAARRDAIMKGKPVKLAIYPQEARFEVEGSGGKAAGSTPVGLSAIGATSESAGTAGHFPREVQIELLDINKLPHEFRNDEKCTVRFFPNGTCDELTIILLSDQGERRAIMLEVTTSLAIIETDMTRVR